jgi:NAD(P)-dependent dehydrogenase (short-subunit alcohol dehydrogenase family)
MTVRWFRLGRNVVGRVVVFLRDPRRGTPFWLTKDYLPTLDPSRFSAIVAAIHEEFPGARDRPVCLSRDRVDGLFTAYWARPEMYLDPEGRRNMPTFQGCGRFPGIVRTCAAKHALEGLSECMAQELAPLGVRVLIVEPGAFRTALFGLRLAEVAHLGCRIRMATDPGS